MLDPFPIAPPVFLIRAIKPVSDALSLHSLPLHAHEIILAAILYTFIEKVFSRWISNQLCPRTYNGLSRKSRLNWDVHVVSFVQSILICALSLYVIWYDEERKAWRPSGEWEGRIWGYYGSGGLCQSFALGYFLWDLYICSMNPEVFGPGMLAHAVSAVAVFGLGYVSHNWDDSFYAPSGMLTQVLAALCLLFCADIPAVRTIIAISEHPLVLRQT